MARSTGASDRIDAQQVRQSIIVESSRALESSDRAQPLRQDAGLQALADGVIILLHTPYKTGPLPALDSGGHFEFSPQQGATPRS